jgi:hypothetical protein
MHSIYNKCVFILYDTVKFYDFKVQRGPSWSWSYDSLIYNYLCNQCLSPLTLWVWFPLWRGVLDTTLCDIVCQWLTTGQCFLPGTAVSSTNETDHHNVAEILLKVVLNTINLTIKVQRFFLIKQWKMMLLIHHFLFFQLET